LWGALTMAMSGGVLGRRLFAVILCGIHQLVAFSVSLLILRHLDTALAGPLLASGGMALMGWLLISWIQPRVERMPDNAGWSYLNIMAVSLFVLLYAAGIWPIFVATESAEHVILFSVAAFVAIVFFPTALAFSERNRLASAAVAVEESLRLMADAMDARREVIAEARKIRNDRRDRRAMLADLLRQGKVKEALDYLERLDAGKEDLQLAESVWCENETVNAILSGYSRKAAAAGLRFSAMASVCEQDIPLPEVEMVEIVSNLLEVAIRTASARGEVTCLLRQRGESFGVTVTNTVSPEFKLTGEKLPLSRSDVCLASVLGLVRKYHGECHYRVSGGQLTGDILLSVEDA